MKIYDLVSFQVGKIVKLIAQLKFNLLNLKLSI